MSVTVAAILLQSKMDANQWLQGHTKHKRLS